MKRQLPRCGRYELKRCDSIFKNMTLFMVLSLTIFVTIIIIIPSYLVMYLWKEACKQEGLDLFSQLLHLLSLTQRQDDCQHDTARVALYISIHSNLVHISYSWLQYDNFKKYK